MQLKNLAVFFLSATALATVEKRDQMDDQIEEALEDAKDQMPSQYQDMPLPDPSVAKAMITAVPPKVMQDPTKMQEVGSSIADGNPPKWIENLPDGGKEYFSSLESWAKGKDGAMPTGASGSDDSSSDSGSSESSETTAAGSAAESGAEETVSSTGGAPAPTGAVAASFAGAVGILGLAVAL